MTKRHLLLLALLGVTAISGVGNAGLKGNYPVTILSGQAYGGLATARASANPNTHIGCSAMVHASPLSYWGYCQARDDAGVNAVCTTSNADLVLQMARVQGDSRINFQFDPVTFACTRVTVDATSVLAPKAP